MRMIDRTRKEGMKNGFQVIVSLLAARAACGGDKFSGQLKEEPRPPRQIHTHTLLTGSWEFLGVDLEGTPGWDPWLGEGGEGHILGLAASLRPG